MENTYNMTERKVSKQLFYFFIPMLFTNLLQQVYSLADMAIVGKGLGDYALGAVGNLSSLTFLIFGFSMGMTGGFSVIIGQNYGAENISKLRRSIALSIKLSAVISMILTVLGILFLKPILLIMQTDELILHDSLVYGYIIFAGLTATIAFNLCSGILRALGDSRTPFIAILVSSIINIVLDYILIFWVQTGVEGTAIATIFAQAVSTLICYIKIRKIDMIRLQHEDFKKDDSMYIELLRNGIPLACMNSVTAIGCIVVQGYVNGLGVVYTSAYSACSRYINFFMLPSVTAGLSISTFTSQNFGAGKFKRIREGVHVCCMIALVSYLILGSVMYLFPEALARLMLNEMETISLVVVYLQICGVSLLLLNIMFVIRNCVQGMGYPIIPMCSGILEMVLRIAIIVLFLPRIGFSAAGYAETAAWSGALVLNLIAYILAIHKNKEDN